MIGPVTDSLLLWVGFNAFVLVMLALDLGVFHRKSHIVSVRESLVWTAIWIAMAMGFCAWIWQARGPDAGLKFLTGYVIEKSLSVDNVFVFALLFSYFSVPPVYQHKVLFWGVLSALVMRGIMIFLGAALISQFHWIIYVFGVFLIFTGIKMLVSQEKEMHPESNPVVKWFKKRMSVTPDFRGSKFFVWENGKRCATPLLIVLLIVEISDLIFAVDSIPAIFAITTDPFLVYTSNVFAIMGLRSLYFALAHVIDRFHYLKYGLAFVLTFVGVKMLLGHTPWKIDTMVSLGIIGLILATSVIASLLRPAAVSPTQLEARPSGSH
jgi:tellurite resistance protein TerC